MFLACMKEAVSKEQGSLTLGGEQSKLQRGVDLEVF